MGSDHRVKNPFRSKPALQLVVATLAIVPVMTGIAGIWTGPSFLHLERPWPADVDSHFRFLSGIFLALGFAWYSCIPDIDRKTGRFRLLAALTFSGGLARLLSLLLAGPPSTGHLAGLFVELVAVPLIVWWQSAIRTHGADPGPQGIPQ